MSPFILNLAHQQQRQQGECLVACTAMVLTYLGIPTHYEQLIKLLKVRKLIGAPASNIYEVEKLGVTVIYRQGTFSEIQAHLEANRPCIAFVNTAELLYWDTDTNHAVVIVGLDESHVYLHDPEFSQGPFKVSQEDFDMAWLEWDELFATFLKS